MKTGYISRLLNCLSERPWSGNNGRHTNSKHHGSSLLIYNRHKSQPLIVFGQLQVAFSQITIRQVKLLRALLYKRWNEIAHIGQHLSSKIMLHIIYTLIYLELTNQKNYWIMNGLCIYCKSKIYLEITNIYVDYSLLIMVKGDQNNVPKTSKI